MRRMKVLHTLLAAIVVLIAFASPASASGPLVASVKPWHYWVSFVLTASALGMFLALGLGYVVRVVFAKYGIKVGRRQAE